MNALQVVGSIKNALLSRSSELKGFLSGDKQAKQFIAAATHLIQTNPRLLECTQQSLVNSLMQCASLDLFPNPAIGLAYLVPYKNKGVLEAQFQIGYQGLVELFYRSGVKSVGAELVYANDHFKEIKGTSPRIDHEPADADDRGELVGCYAWAKLSTNEIVFKYMTAKEIISIAKMGKSYSSSFSPWKSNDPEKWMWKKTVVKQLSKLVPKADVFAKAVAIDNESEGINHDNIVDAEIVIEVNYDQVIELIEGATTHEEMQVAKSLAMADIAQYSPEQKAQFKQFFTEKTKQITELAKKEVKDAEVVNEPVQQEISPEPKQKTGAEKLKDLAAKKTSK